MTYTNFINNSTFFILTYKTTFYLSVLFLCLLHEEASEKVTLHFISYEISGERRGRML